MQGIMSQQPLQAKAVVGENPSRRPVRSFVRRAGRLTDGQKRALEQLWPRYGVEPGGSAADPACLFGVDHPVILEIGFGDGAATWRMAQANPELNFLGVEVHRPGIGRLLLALEREGLDNVRVACGDAVEFLRDFVRPHTLDGVCIFFPDPWPKKRHHKRRLIQPDFVALLAARMKPGAVLHLATDWQPYAEHMKEVLDASPLFEDLAGTQMGDSQAARRPRTKYERRGERLGHRVIDLVSRRTPASGEE
jgi:tRNA (guanine-N7-)-methyltransferase